MHLFDDKKEHHCITNVKWQQISFANWPWHRPVGWPLASYGRFKFIPRAVCGICGGQNGTGRGFVMFTSVPCSCSYTIDMLQSQRVIVLLNRPSVIRRICCGVRPCTPNRKPMHKSARMMQSC